MKTFKSYTLTPEQEKQVKENVDKVMEKYKDIAGIECVADPRWKTYLLYETDLLRQVDRNKFNKVKKPLTKKGWTITCVAGAIWTGEPPNRKATSTWMGYYAVKEKVTNLDTDQYDVQVEGRMTAETSEKAYQKMQEWINNERQ